MSALKFVVVSILVVVSFSVDLRQRSYDGPWRKSLDGRRSCWTENYNDCDRVMTISHGGDWNLTYPYDSLQAFQKAFENGADAVKGDFRVSKDNVGVVMHSSPIEIYESLNCHGMLVENMTAEDCTKCQMALTDYHFITVPQFLSWSNGKVNVMLCVKESTDIQRAITTVVENDATHRAFLELHVDELITVEQQNYTSWQDVYYIAEIKSLQDFTR
jgi:glycerophosphoryl diester phosphodiesterase